MFKSSLKLAFNTKNVFRNNRVNFQTSASLKEKWDLLTAVLIERKPLICPELDDLEKEFKAYLSAVEFEKSLKNETEIKLEKERKAMSEKKNIDDIDITVQQTTLDLVDAYKEELEKFQVADRITSADKSNDLTSLNRKLDKHLIFVLNQKLGQKNYYLLPQGKREDGETLRQCADRVIKEKCGNDLKVQVFGNAPCGFYKYKYPKGVQSEDSVGAKIFIYFARYSSGQVTDKGAEFKWLDKSELNEVLPEPYRKSVLPIVFD